MNEEELYRKVWDRKINTVDGKEKWAYRETYIVPYLPGGNRLLDVGCGSGIIMNYVKSKYSEIYGIDINEGVLEKARLKGVKTTCLNLNSEGLPYSEDYFDSVVSLDVIEHIFDPEYFLKEMARVLKPKGNFIMSTPNIGFIKHRIQLALFGRFPKTSDDPEGFDGGHIHYWTVKDMTGLLKRYGFKIVHITGLGKFMKIRERLPNLLIGGVFYICQKVRM